MTIQEIKIKLDELVHEYIYVNKDLNKNLEKKLNQVIFFFNGLDNPLEAIKDILRERNNENYAAYDYFLEKILTSIKKETRINILNNKNVYSPLFKNNMLFFYIWNSLKYKEKMDYLKKCQKFTEIEVLLINKTFENLSLKNSIVRDILTNEELLKKIPSFTISLNYSKALLKYIPLDNYELAKIFTKKTYTALLLKKCQSFTEFYKIYQSNNNIFKLLEKNGLIFKNHDNKIIYEFILKNNNFIGKFHTKYLTLFNIVEISKMYKNSNLDGDSYAVLTDQLYKYNNELANEYYSEEKIKRCSLHSLCEYPFDNIGLTLKETIFHNYNLFNRFIDTIMIQAINNYFEEDDILSLLRTPSFVEDISDYAIELLLNKLSFKTVFNMLQSKTILEKVNNLNVVLSSNDSIFMKGYLDSPALINKTDHNMIYEMLLYFNSEEVLYYLSVPYINNKLSNCEIINLCIQKNISIQEIINENSLMEKLNKDDIINYIDHCWESNIDLTIFNDKNIAKLLFNLTDEQVLKIDFDEVNYLFETIRMKSILSTQITKYTLLTYKSVLASYLVFGLNKTIELISNGNKDITLDDVRELKDSVINEKLLKYREDNASLIQNISNKVIDNLKLLEGYNDINSFAKVLRRNTYLDNIVFLMLDSNYDSYNKIIEVFYNSLKYYNYNIYESKKEIYDYCNGFVKKFINNKYIQYENDFDKIILSNFKLKENILYSKRNEIGKEYLNKLKLKIFVRALTDPNKDSYKYAFREDYPISDIKEKFIKYLKHSEVDFDSVLEHVLIPLVNERFDKINCLKQLNIIKPKNYDLYYDYIEDLKHVTILNTEIENLKKKYDEDELLQIMNYICYGNKINFKIKVKEIRNFDKLANLISYLTGEIYVDKSSLKFIYTDNLDIYNTDEIIEYNNYINILDEIIAKTNNYVKRHMVTSKIKEYFAHDYLKVVNKEQFVLPISDKYYELKRRVFSLKDLENIFNGFDISNYKEVDSSLNDFLFNNKNLVMVADGYYEGIIDNFGLIISEWKRIKEKCKELEIDIDQYNLITIHNVLRLLDFDFGNIGNNISNDIIKSLCDDSYYIDLDLNSRISNLINLYQNSFKSIYTTVPYIDVKSDNYRIKVVDKYDQEMYRCFRNSIYKIGARGNDFLHYAVLNKNGFKVVIEKDNSIISRFFGLRNGNTIYLNSMEGMPDSFYKDLLHLFANQLIEQTKDDVEPIEFVTIVNNGLFNSDNGLKIDNTICPIVDNPINFAFDDYEVFMNYPNLNTISENGFYTNYGDNITTLLASSLIVDKNNFKYYDPDDKYCRRRNSVIKLSNNIESGYLAKINMIIKMCELENIDVDYKGDISLSLMRSIYLGDDFVLFESNTDQIIKYVLPYDKRAMREIDLIMESLKERTMN